MIWRDEKCMSKAEICNLDGKVLDSETNECITKEQKAKKDCMKKGQIWRDGACYYK